ncbi:ROK family protein [Streptacidiphilus monticola]
MPGSTVRCPCGRTGCLQVTVSDRALGDAARAAGVAADLAGLVRAAAAGDARALELCRGRLRAVAHAVGLLVDMISPETLVLTEAVTMYLPELLGELRAELAAGAAARVHASSFGPHALAVAAGAPVLAAVHHDPSPSARPAPRARPRRGLQGREELREQHTTRGGSTRRRGRTPRVVGWSRSSSRP